MPKGTPVEKQYQGIKKSMMSKGMGKKEAEMHAAMIAQHNTGLSLTTGKPPKHSERHGTHQKLHDEIMGE